MPQPCVVPRRRPAASAPARPRVRAASMSALLAAVAGALLVPVSCGPVPDTRSPDVDLKPPQVQSVQASSPAEISIQFDEEAALSDGKTRITPPLAVQQVTAAGSRVVVQAEAQAPGRRYDLEAEARDTHGNTASFDAEFYGYNARTPALLINELTPRGSGSHPDAVELKCLAAGNIGGVVLYLGCPEDNDGRFVFPPLEVAAGAFIVLHLKPSGDPAEVDETSRPDQSGGFDALPTAWDFWMKDSPGLPGNNGVLSVYDRPGGSVRDAVVWSNRTSQSDEQYGGFGSEQMRCRVEELVRLGAWKAAGQRVSPEDAVNPEGSTATRSLCRAADGRDTNSAADWHIVPTRKASLGTENSDDVYAP